MSVSVEGFAFAFVFAFVLGTWSAFCARSAWIRLMTYSVTCSRSSMPVDGNKDKAHAVSASISITIPPDSRGGEGGNHGSEKCKKKAKRLDVPRISVSGKAGDSATSRPPNPQPMSAISIWVVKLLGCKLASLLSLPLSLLDDWTKAG